MSFNANEILEIAVQIERNGMSFYRRASEHAGSEANREMLLDLASMEADHEQTFLDLQAALAAAPSGSQLIRDSDEETMQFIRSVADGHVFDVAIDPVKILTGEETPREILSTAIGLEKETIVYYAALEQIIIDEPARKKILDVIREEMTHVAQLSGQRAALVD